MRSLSGSDVRALLAAAGIEVADDQLDSITRGLKRVRGLAAELRSLDLAGVAPWTPPS